MNENRKIALTPESAETGEKEKLVLDEFEDLYLKIIELLKNSEKDLDNPDNKKEILSKLEKDARSLSFKISQTMSVKYSSEEQNSMDPKVKKIEKARMITNYFITSCSFGDDMNLETMTEDMERDYGQYLKL